MSRYVSFGVLLAVIALLCVLFYKILAGFLVPLFLAALMVVIFQPVHLWVLKKCKGRKKTAALLTTLGIFLAVLIPLAALLTLAVLEGKDAAGKFNSGNNLAKLVQIRSNLGLDTPVSHQIRDIENNFEDMRENWAAKDIEYHSEKWFDVIQLASQLEDHLAEKRKTPEASNDVEIENQLTELAEIREMFFEARDLRDEMLIQYEDDPKDPNLLGRLGEYHEKITDAATRFTEFKNWLLGGRTLANLKLLANPSEEDIANYSASLVDAFQGKLIRIGGATTAFIINLLVGGAIMMISLYFFFLDGPAMVEAFYGLSPLDDEHEKELAIEFSRVSRAVVIATLLSALVQGLLAGIGYYFCGFESIILMTILTTALALVPFVGAASVWISASLYLFFFDQNIGAAIGLALYGAIIVSMADNFIKPIILHGQSNLHPLFALLSILGGVSALGPVGLLVGPMVVAFLQTLLKILQRELKSMESEPTTS